MKILIVSTSYPPYISGVATSTANLANYLSKSHEVKIIAGGNVSRPRKKQLNPNLTLYLFPGITIRRQKPSLVLPYPYPKQIKQIIASFRPKIIHLQDFSPIHLSVFNLAKQQHIPVLMTHHFTAEFVVKTIIANSKLSNTLSQTQITKQLIYRLVNLFYNHCQLIIVPNHNLIAHLKKAHLKTPVMAIPNGIFIKNFQRKTKLTQVLNQYAITQPQMILYVGRLEIDKNIDVLIEAFNIVHQYNPQTSLVLVGDGNKKLQFLNQVKKLYLTDSVYFVGKIDNTNPQLSHLYNAASIFASASIIESQGVVFIEALAAGLPIVACQTPILASIINPGINGLLFELGNPGALAVCLQKLLSNQKLRRVMAANNRQLSKQYDISLTSQQYLKAYRSLI